MKRACCSSQEEHVLKPLTRTGICLCRKLLLARGACIETYPQTRTVTKSLLLLARGACIETKTMRTPRDRAQLLLARGACIETKSVRCCMTERLRCSSQEEHVLKPDPPPSPRRTSCCSSQEEHVLKQIMNDVTKISPCCSSQEEHVLKQSIHQAGAQSNQLLLARGACIETTSHAYYRA